MRFISWLIVFARINVGVILFAWVAALFVTPSYDNFSAYVIDSAAVKPLATWLRIGGFDEGWILYARSVRDGAVIDPNLPPEEAGGYWMLHKPHFETKDWLPQIERLYPPPRSSWWSGYRVTIPHWIVLFIAIAFERAVTILTRRYRAVNACKGCGYSMLGLKPLSACPECGFDRAASRGSPQA